MKLRSVRQHVQWALFFCIESLSQTRIIGATIPLGQSGNCKNEMTIVTIS